MNQKLKVLCFRNLAIIANTPGPLARMAQSELTYMSRRLGLARQTATQIIEDVQTGAKDLRFPGNPDEVRRMIYLMCYVATLGGSISHEAKRVIEQVAAHYDISPEEVEQAMGQASVRPPMEAIGRGHEASGEEAGEEAGKPVDQATLLIGQIARRKGWVSAEALDHALHVQQRRWTDTGRHTPLGEILRELDYVDEEQLAELLHIRKLNEEYRELRQEARYYGHIAVQNGFATSEQVEECLRLQRDHFISTRETRLLGDLMLEQGMVTEQEHRAILAVQMRLKQKQQGGGPA